MHLTELVLDSSPPEGFTSKCRSRSFSTQELSADSFQSLCLGSSLESFFEWVGHVHGMNKRSGSPLEIIMDVLLKSMVGASIDVLIHDSMMSGVTTNASILPLFANSNALPRWGC